jgi:hypothetical protein
MGNQKRVRQPSERGMQELQQEKSKHYDTRNAGLAAWRKKHGERKAIMESRKMSIP